MKWVILVTMVLAGIVGCGCDQTTIITINETTAEAGAPFMVTDAGNDAPEELDTSPLPLVAGAPCDDDFECASDVCMPSANDFSAGYCFARTMEGCIVVTALHPVKALCSSVTRSLYVCGDSWDVASLGDCDDVAVGDLGEHYHCCKKPGAP